MGGYGSWSCLMCQKCQNIAKPVVCTSRGGGGKGAGVCSRDWRALPPPRVLCQLALLLLFLLLLLLLPQSSSQPSFIVSNSKEQRENAKTFPTPRVLCQLGLIPVLLRQSSFQPSIKLVIKASQQKYIHPLSLCSACVSYTYGLLNHPCNVLDV